MKEEKLHKKGLSGAWDATVHLWKRLLYLIEDGGIRAQSSHPDALEAARSKEATEGLGNEDISMGEALKATSPQSQFAASQGRALERGAFGSFVHHS